jgi:hypothetical protein
MKILGLLLIVGGAISLAYNRVTFSSGAHKTEIGPVDISVKDTQHIVIPQWAGIAAIAVGGLMLIVPAKKK